MSGYLRRVSHVHVVLSGAACTTHWQRGELVYEGLSVSDSQVAKLAGIKWLLVAKQVVHTDSIAVEAP